jgi:hypothetical protein
MKWTIFKVVALHQSIRMLVDDMTNCRKSDRLHQRQQMQWDVSLCIWHGTKTGRAISSTLGDRWTMSNKDFLLKRPSRSSKVKVAWYIWFGKTDGSLTNSCCSTISISKSPVVDPCGKASRQYCTAPSPSPWRILSVSIFIWNVMLDGCDCT